MSTFLRAMLAVLSLAAAAAAACAAEGPSRAADPLNGLRFEGQAGEKGKADHHKDVVMFSDGMFRALNCENWGFRPARYSVEKKGDAYYFRSTLMSPDRGKLEWSGRIIGDRYLPVDA